MKNKYHSILIIDECDQPIAYYVLRCLKSGNQNLKISIIIPLNQSSIENNWITFYKYSRYIDRLIIASNEIDSNDFLNEVIQAIQQESIDYIFPASENSFKFVSRHRVQLSSSSNLIALPSQNSLDVTFNKWELSLFLKNRKIPTPKTILPSSITQSNQLSYPILLKPACGSGGENIKKIEEVSVLKSIIHNPIAKNDYKDYILQEYIDGYDIDCNVLCKDGKILTHSVQKPLGIEKGFSPKIDKLHFIHDNSVLSIVKKTMFELQWSGIAHLDLRYCHKTGNLYLIEINPRFWQSLMGSLSIGINFPYLLFLVSAGFDIGDVYYDDQYYAKFSRYIKDILSGSLDYSLDNTNLKYLLTDLNSIANYGIKRFFGSKTIS
ncbi:ATP-grasp domain-containing protein [Acaryochloris marina]|nr:ATP-grasp domain-containing protein [Acaryochloris marina]